MKDTEANAALVESAGAEIVSSRNPDLVRIRDCNWRVLGGQYWVVGGAHGSGKSDLLATAAGLQRPRGGSLRLFGDDIAGLGESELLAKRLRVGFVFNSGGRMFADLTVA